MSTGNEGGIFNSDELKDFRKLKGVNWVVRIVLALAVGAVAYKLLPYGVSIVENMFQITLGLGKTFIIGVPLFFAVSFAWANRTLFRKERERLSRKLWKWFIYNDPIDYIQGVIDGFKQDYKSIQIAIQKLIAASELLRGMAEDLIKEARGNMDRAKAMMDEEKDEQKASFYAYMSNRGMDTTDEIVAGFTEIEDSIEVMKEFGESVGLRIEALEFDLRMMDVNIRVSDAKRDAALAAQSVLDNKSREAAELEIARNGYKEKVAEGAAQFKQFMNRIKPILDADHIDRVIATKEGRAILDQFKKGVDIGGLKSFEEQLNVFKKKNEIFSRTTARERIPNQRAEAVRISSSSKFSNLS